jgi:putative FmdB family regulatory protein
MPTYEYHCDACEHEFELFQGITEPAKKKCPECGKPKLRRLFGTGAAVVFKGSGFYQTDYRSESYKKGVEKEKGSQEKPSAEKPEGKKTSAAAGDAGGAGEKKASSRSSKKSKPE